MRVYQFRHLGNVGWSESGRTLLAACMLVNAMKNKPYL